MNFHLLFESSSSSLLLRRGNAIQSSLIPLGQKREYLLDTGLGQAKICLSSELTGVPINRAARFENKVGFRNHVVNGESRIRKHLLERFFIDLVSGDSRIKERAAARFHSCLGSRDVVNGEQLLLPQRFRQSRVRMELKKNWRTKKKVRGRLITKGKGGYSVSIAGIKAFSPFSAFNKQKRALKIKNKQRIALKKRRSLKKKKMLRMVLHKWTFKLSLTKLKGRPSLVVT